MENYRNKEVGQSLLGLAKAPAVIENQRDYRGRKFLNVFNKNKAIKRCVRFHIAHSVPHSSASKSILSFDYRNYRETRICRCKPVGITRAKGSRLYFEIGYVYLFKTGSTKDKKKSQISVVFHDGFVHVVQCSSIKCKKRNHK